MKTREAEQAAVQDFFRAWAKNKAKSTFSQSKWTDKHTRGATDTLSCEDIVWHAMKNLVNDDNGQGRISKGNRSAQVLLSRYGIPMDTRPEALSRLKEKLATKTYDNENEKTFIQAVLNVALEKQIIKEFLADEEIRKSADLTNGFLWQRKYWNGINVNDLRLMDIIRHKRGQTPGIKAVENFQIEGIATAYAPSSSEHEEKSESAPSSSASSSSLSQEHKEEESHDQEKRAQRQKLVRDTLAALDKEAAIVKEFYTTHQTQKTEDGKAWHGWYRPRSSIPEEKYKKPEQTNLANLIEDSEKGFFSRLFSLSYSCFVSHKRSRSILETATMDKQQSSPRSVETLEKARDAVGKSGHDKEQKQQATDKKQRIDLQYPEEAAIRMRNAETISFRRR